jgi:1,4-alpha-glucan branching enzyme
MIRESRSKKRVTFKLCAPEARTVSIAGSFNGWNEFSHPLKKSAKWMVDGIWQKAIYLEPGTHEYRYIVDGSWQDDPLCCQHCLNEFGTSNCLVRI